jgi:hypothetical protein
MLLLEAAHHADEAVQKPREPLELPSRRSVDRCEPIDTSAGVSEPPA